MDYSISPGIAALALTGAGGVWVAISPFVMNSQPAGVWGHVAVNNVATGMILIIASLLGIGSHLVLTLLARAQTAQEPAASRPPATRRDQETAGTS
jgi:hypothetical protein